MSELTENSSLGCAVCNPALQRPRDEIISEQRAEIAGRMHIARMGDGYHLLEIPGPDGAPFKAWPGPFETEAAASLFLTNLIEAYVAGKPEDACCSYGIFEHFNLAGRLLAVIEQHEGDNRTLANELASTRPWAGRNSGVDRNEIPF